jgi:outer membrane murein-binding lipoprotein Lpp
MNPPLQTYPDLLTRIQMHPYETDGRFLNRDRRVTLLTAVIAVILAISLVYGCAKENKDLSKLQEENRVLKEKIASLESQMKPGKASKPEMKEELLVLARKLKATPNDFVGQQIKLHCRFGGFENKFLNDTNGPKFLSTYYIGLITQSGKEINEPLFDHLFISKKEAKEQGVYRLGVNDLITVYGIVNSAYKNEPWIEVYVVKRGWE